MIEVRTRSREKMEHVSELLVNIFHADENMMEFLDDQNIVRFDNRMNVFKMKKEQIDVREFAEKHFQSWAIALSDLNNPESFVIQSSEGNFVSFSARGENNAVVTQGKKQGRSIFDPYTKNKDRVYKHSKLQEVVHHEFDFSFECY